jgi:replicative DNA helicase
MNETKPSLIEENVEAQMIGAVLMNGALLAKAGFLKPEDFAIDVHQTFWGVIKHMTGKGMVATPNSVAAHLATAGDGTRDYLRDCAAMGEGIPARTIEDMAGHLKDLSLRRTLIAVSDEMKRKAENFDALADEVLAETIGDVQRLAGDGLKRGVSKREAALAAVEQMKGGLPCYPTHLETLDMVMGGGMFAGKCYGVAARKKVGKTVLLGTISHNLNMAGVKHLYLCLEMNGQELEQRNMARHLQVNTVAFMQNPPGHLVQRCAEYALHVQDNTIYEDCAGATLDDIRRMVASAIAKHRIKGIVLDYWQLVGGKNGNENETYHLGRVAQWIADVCRKERIFALVAAQLNQEGNTRGGEGLKLACDMYFTLNRDKDQDGAWLEMEESRYTMYANVGSEFAPGLRLNKCGPHFEDTGLAAEMAAQ